MLLRALVCGRVLYCAHPCVGYYFAKLNNHTARARQIITGRSRCARENFYRPLDLWVSVNSTVHRDGNPMEYKKKMGRGIAQKNRTISQILGLFGDFCQGNAVEWIHCCVEERGLYYEGFLAGKQHPTDRFRRVSSDRDAFMLSGLSLFLGYSRRPLIINRSYARPCAEGKVASRYI